MVIILLSDGFNETEVLYSIKQLRENGIDVKTVALGDRIVTGAYGIPVVCDLTADDVDFTAVYTVIFPENGSDISSVISPTVATKLLGFLANKKGKLASICTTDFALKNTNQIKTSYTALDNVIKETETADNAKAITPRDPSPKKSEQDHPAYKLPSPELLEKSSEYADGSIQIGIQKKADELLAVLDSFGVGVSIAGVDVGPRLTRFQLVPTKGVKVSSILNLGEEIALGLKVDSLRMEAPIPGKSAIGIEIPNETCSTVKLRELIEDGGFKAMKSNTSVCLGCDVCGEYVFADVAKMPHLILSGASDMGKTAAIHCMMVSMLYKATPDELKFILIDTKYVNLSLYRDLPHLQMPVITDHGKAIGALKWAVDETERRYKILKKEEVCDIEAYNEKVKSGSVPGKYLHRIVIVIDDFADLMLPNVNIAVERLIMRLTQKSRAVGINVILVTQRPSVNVLTDVIRSNIPSRLACKLFSAADSRVALEYSGAEKLLDRGDMLYAPAGSPKPLRIQGAYVSDDEVLAIVEYVKKSVGRAVYDGDVLDAVESGANIDNSTFEEEIKEEEKQARIEAKIKEYTRKVIEEEKQKSEDSFSCLSNQQFLDAVDYAIACGQIRTGMLQRKLSIGYGKAAKYIDIMADFGLVGEPDGCRPRTVIMTAEEWQKKLKSIPRK